MRGLLLAAVVVLAGCVSAPPPTPDQSPLPAPFRSPLRVYAPLVMRSPEQTPGKMGLAGCAPNLAAYGFSWCYGWSPVPGTLPGIETVPMIWGENDVAVDVQGSSAWLLGINEGDLPQQANLTPETAAVVWRIVEQRFPKHKLVAPAPSHLHPEWLSQMRAAYQARYRGAAPRFDALAVHCYWPTARQCIGEIQRYLGWAREWGVDEVWLTEFYIPSESETRSLVAWLNKEPRLTRWAPYTSYLPCGEQRYWYGWDCVAQGDPSLFTTDGRLTAIGAWYVQLD